MSILLLTALTIHSYGMSVQILSYRDTINACLSGNATQQPLKCMECLRGVRVLVCVAGSRLGVMLHDLGETV